MEKKLIDNLNKELSLSSDQLEVVAFGYKLLVYSILGYLAIGILAYIAGTVVTTLTAAITASVFRIFSGGAHASTQKRCVAMGAIIFNILGFIANTYYSQIPMDLLMKISWGSAILALVSFIVYAPADTPGKPITSKVKKGKLKGISIVLLLLWCVAFNFIIKGEININGQYLVASALGLAWQSVTLWPFAYRWIIFK